MTAPLQCQVCDKTLDRRAKHPLCQVHFNASRYIPRKNCSGCGKQLSLQAKGEHCRSCVMRAMNRDPALRQRAIASMRRHYADESFLEKFSAKVSAAKRAKLASDPEYAAKVRERGSALGKSGLGLATMPAGSEVRKRAAAAVSEHYMAWCPEEYRDDYRRLMKRNLMKRDRAQTIILAKVEADRRRAAEERAAYLAGLSPFERQVHALRNGARLVEKPVLRRDYDFTLGGVSDMAA